MKKTVLAFVSLTAAAFLSGCNQQPSATPGNSAAATNAMSAPAPAATGTNLLADDMSRESYAVGMSLGHTWKTRNVTLNLDMVFRGIEDEESNTPTLLTDSQAQDAIEQLKRDLAMAQQKMQQLEGETNQQEGETFLAQNKTKPGVVTLPDGLQYKIIADGSGPTPGADDTVMVNYTGKFVDGTVFDSSERYGPPSHPAQFPVRGVIPGWTEGLEKMKVGSKWELYIPSNLAYGPNGYRGIPPNKTLIFDVELVGIKPGTPPPAPQPLTSDIIKVPSAEEMKNGAQIETIKASDLQKMQQGATNQ